MDNILLKCNLDSKIFGQMSKVKRTLSVDAGTIIQQCEWWSYWCKTHYRNLFIVDMLMRKIKKDTDINM